MEICFIQCLWTDKPLCCISLIFLCPGRTVVCLNCRPSTSRYKNLITKPTKQTPSSASTSGPFCTTLNNTHSQSLVFLGQMLDSGSLYKIPSSDKKDLPCISVLQHLAGSFMCARTVITTFLTEQYFKAPSCSTLNNICRHTFFFFSF